MIRQHFGPGASRAQGCWRRNHMVKSQGRWARSLAYGATALLVIAACSSGNTPTAAPGTPSGTTAPVATPTAKPATSTTPQSAPPAASSTPATSPNGSPTGTTQPSGSPRSEEHTSELQSHVNLV